MKEIIKSFIELGDKVLEQEKEIERLNTDKEQLTSLVNSCQEDIRKLKSQLQQKENIIKEVKEYVIQETNNINAITYINILDLLDKEVN